MLWWNEIKWRISLSHSAISNNIFAFFFLSWYLKSKVFKYIISYYIEYTGYDDLRIIRNRIFNNLWIYINRYKCSKRFLIFVYHIMTDNSKRKINVWLWFDPLEFARRRFSSLSLLIQLNGFSPANSMFFHFFSEWFWRENLVSVTQTPGWSLITICNQFASEQIFGFNAITNGW